MPGAFKGESDRLEQKCTSMPSQASCPLYRHTLRQKEIFGQICKFLKRASSELVVCILSLLKQRNKANFAEVQFPNSGCL